jgi:hypothetical protein
MLVLFRKIPSSVLTEYLHHSQVVTTSEESNAGGNTSKYAVILHCDFIQKVTCVEKFAILPFSETGFARMSLNFWVSPERHYDTMSKR